VFDVLLHFRKGDGGDKNEELADKYKARALEIQAETKAQKSLSFQEGIKPV